jgi:hypothetical protein
VRDQPLAGNVLNNIQPVNFVQGKKPQQRPHHKLLTRTPEAAMSA